MDFKVFDTTKIDEYSKRAKEQWGQTSEYKEFEEKTKNWTKDDEATDNSMDKAETMSEKLARLQKEADSYRQYNRRMSNKLR